MAPEPSGPSQEDLVTFAIRHARRLIILVVGSTVALLGVAMLVLPGPGVVVLLGGLAILAAEFAWARRLLRRARKGAQQAQAFYNSKSKERHARRWWARFSAWTRGLFSRRGIIA